MSLDPRAPVLIGAGQFLNKATGLDDALDAHIDGRSERVVRLHAFGKAVRIALARGLITV